MDGTKPWWASQGAWANLLQVVVSLLTSYHLLTPSEGTVVVSQGPGVAVAVVMACLGAWGLWARLVATKRIG